MSPDSHAPGSLQEWLQRAEGHLAIAQAPLPAGGYWEDLCFHAHHAAELAIKAVYQHHGWIFPYVHDLAELLDRLQDNGLDIAPEVREAEELSTYAVETRYPGLAPPVTEPEYQEAIRIARAVVDWAQALIP